MTATARKRNRASAKKAGADFERLIADYLAQNLSEFIDRRVKTGARDRGDLTGLRNHLGLRGVAELKNLARMALGPGLAEAEVERVNDNALWSMLIHKAHGKGQPGDQLVTMRLQDLVALMTGVRPPVHLVDDPLPLHVPRTVESVSTDVDTPPRRVFSPLIPAPDDFEPDGLNPPGYTPTLTEENPA